MTKRFWVYTGCMSRKEDPKRTKLRAAREAAQVRLNVLCKGIGHALADGYQSCAEDIRPIIVLVNTELVAAVDAHEAAEEAYRPYWSRHRRAYVRRVQKKKKPVRPVASSEAA